MGGFGGSEKRNKLGGTLLEEDGKIVKIDVFVGGDGVSGGQVFFLFGNVHG